MFTIAGKYGIAKVLQSEDMVEDACKKQITKIMGNSATENQNVAIMPDCHAGKGSVIGYTQTIGNKVIPNTVGVDIGCGIYAWQLKHNLTKPELEKLDKVIRQNIPLGKNHRKTLHRFVDNVFMKHCIANVNEDELKYSIATLGGGNHFIEIDTDENDNQWLVIHSGSRHLGVEVCDYWQNKAVESHSCAKACKEKVAELKAAGRLQDIETELDKIKAAYGENTDAELAYVEGADFDGYLHDMEIAQEYAHWNRLAMADVIQRWMNIKFADEIFSVHNYIDLSSMILRKGSTALNEDQLAVIPINMSYGTLIVKGYGNKEYNCSGPHGAGRLMSRTKARETLKMEDYKASMEGIYTTSVSTATIDEAPMAYKPVEAVLDNLKELGEVVGIIKPTYNLKAGD